MEYLFSGAVGVVMLLGAVNFNSFATEPPVQQAECGRIERMLMYSPQMGDTLTIDTWLPPVYDLEPAGRYPVIYMHDGQNLYDASTTWNHQSWEMDSVMCSLIETHQIEPAIIVGVHSSPSTRVADLMPQKAVAGHPLEATLEMVKLKGLDMRGDAYAAFMTETLKPEVDLRYRTLADQAHTSVAGSSMGGLMSIYALCEYPEVFGNALCLSTHWIGTPAVAKEFEDAMYEYLDRKLPSPADHRLYFDHGTETIDAYYGPAEERILRLVKSKGYSYGDGTLLNIVDSGAPHEEQAWAARVAVPLRFLLNGMKQR
ncbi:MAG: alpha/beta hydrolase [Bacteroides sp.]|nr:alpha/beta hydrolase [Bacteroides sp.]